VTDLGSTWRSAALDLVERVAEALDREQALGGIFSTLQRHVDFDCASAVSLEGAEFVSFDKPELCRTVWAANAARYLDEGRPVLEAGIARNGVILDCDVLSTRERDRSRFYDEYMRPLGARSSVMFLVQAGPSVTQILSLTRTGASTFSSAELHALRLLQPSVSVAARVFPGVSSAVRPKIANPSPLTVREAEIVEYLVRGLQNAEIASCVGTSKHTVRNQIQRVFRKLDVTTRAELVAVVLANGWARGFHPAESIVPARPRRPV
jgi:DNA-binding CsgD family transcriptional regulator